MEDEKKLIIREANAPDALIFGQAVVSTTLTVERVAAIIEATYPKIWHRVYTKHIDGPGNYMGFKAVAVALGSTCVEATTKSTGESSNGAMIAGILERYDYPVYHVSEALFQALKHTHPPKGMTWNEITWPYDGIVFMLPRGVLFEPEKVGGAEIFMLGVARLKGGDTVEVPGTRIRILTMPEDRIDVFWSIKPCGLTMQDCCFPAGHPLEPDADWIDEKTKSRDWGDGSGQSAYGNPSIWGPDGLPSGDFSSGIAGLVANFLLFMSARKELVDKGRKTERKLKSGVVVHTPSFLGLKYVVQKKEHATGAPGAHYTELGWRAGHYRRQHYGVQGAEVRMVLIDPYIAYSRMLVRETK